MNRPCRFSNAAKDYLSTFYCILDEMICKMTKADLTDSISHNFILQMIPHHRAAIEMSGNILKYTTNKPLQEIASQIIAEQTKSIENMQKIKCTCGKLRNSRQDLCRYQRRVDQIMQTMFSEMRCARATSGGTDFIAVALSDKFNVDAWNYILLGNAVMLAIAGLLFGWDKALYSIIFQFASTQVVKMLNFRYKRTTLFIISDRSEEIYEHIKEFTHHGATLFYGTGLYNGEPRTMIYSVISGDQVKKLTKKVREADPKAFINILKTDQVAGNFYQRPND